MRIYRIGKKPASVAIGFCLALLVYLKTQWTPYQKVQTAESEYHDRLVFDITSLAPRFNSTLACNIPLYIDPWDLSAEEYFKPQKLECPKGHLLTYVDDRGVLRKNSTYSAYLCKYSFMKRRQLDRVNDYTQLEVLTADGVQLTDEKPFATTTCFGTNGKPVYTNTHMRIPDFKISQTSEGAPSMFILVLESLSRLSYYRFLPKVKEAMDRLGNFQILSGLTKVGRNSFPNSFSFLTGVPMKDEDCAAIGTWDNKFRYLWDDFKDSGYLTAFAEDMALAGLFTYYQSGWKNPPTDWYPTPFWINMYPTSKKDWSKIWTSFREYCYAAEGKKSDMFMKQMREFVHKMHQLNQTYFMYSFYSQSIHEDFDYYPFIDDAVAEFVNSLTGKLDNTLLIVMGDHGTMHGSFATESILGHLEGSLPFFAIRVPDKLHQRHPHLRRYLNQNYNRLLSWWDIREMVLDVARGTYDEQPAPQVSVLSPWRSFVPDERTCQDAKIAYDWCVCNGILGPKPKADLYYNALADDVVGLLNEKLRGSKCSYFRSVNFYQIRHILPKESEEIALKELISLYLKVLPGNFRAHVIIERKRMEIQTPWPPWKLVYSDLSSIKEKCYSLSSS